MSVSAVEKLKIVKIVDSPGFYFGLPTAVSFLGRPTLPGVTRSVQALRLVHR